MNGKFFKRLQDCRWVLNGQVRSRGVSRGENNKFVKHSLSNQIKKD
jgi:hypothetical protein